MLEMKLISKRESIESVLECIDLKCGGIENFIDGLPTYDKKELIEFAQDNCWICGGFETEGEYTLEGLFIFSWVTEKIVNLHICTMNNKYNWHQFYKSEVKPFIAQHAKYQIGFVKPEQKALVRLYKRYGYELEWDEDLKLWKSLTKLV